ncbi:MAG TPA: TIGR01777 family oxidoreductase [Opitutaceae bacterium]
MSEQHFVRSIRLPCAAGVAFAWHERPGALERLTPPWEHVRVLHRSGTGVNDGARVELATRAGPFWFRWEAEHFGHEPGRQFCDRLVRGPLPRWEHRHGFADLGGGESVLTDDIGFELPGGVIGAFFGAARMRRRLERLFTYRHAIIREDLSLIPAPPLRVLISGASGLVGQALIPFLTTQGHSVVRLVRRKPATADEIFWDPSKGTLDLSSAGAIDAVVHLAGENIAAGRWTAARKESILASRVDGLRTLAAELRRTAYPPRVFLSASAVGFYGDRGDELLTEDSPAGTGFLSEVCQTWEAELASAGGVGMRTAALRFGMVLTPAGGALARMLPAFRFGIGGPLGDGRQWMSWIAIDDVLGVIAHALRDRRCEGPINAVAPEPVRNYEFTARLAAILRRPVGFRAPAAGLRLAFGELADALLLGSVRAMPSRLEESGYRFRLPMLDSALRHVLGQY